MALFECPECGNMVSTTADHCPNCGMVFTVCPECGQVIKGEATQCPNCGAKLTKNEPVQEQKPEQSSTQQTTNDINVDYNTVKLVDIWKSKQPQMADNVKLYDKISKGVGSFGAMFFVSACILLIIWTAEGDPLEQLARMENVIHFSTISLWIGGVICCISVIFNIIRSYKLNTAIIKWLRNNPIDYKKYFLKYINPNAQDQFEKLGSKDDSSTELKWYYIAKNPQAITSFYLYLVFQSLFGFVFMIALPIVLTEVFKLVVYSEIWGAELASYFTSNWTPSIVCGCIAGVFLILGVAVDLITEGKGKKIIKKEMIESGAVKYSSPKDSE